MDNVSLPFAVSLVDLTRYFAREPGTTLFYSGGNYDSSQRSMLCLFPFEYVTIEGEHPWDQLKQKLNFSHNHNSPEWVGYLSYEMGATSDDYQLDLPLPTIPLAYFQRHAVVLTHDHPRNQTTLSINNDVLHLLTLGQREWIEKIRKGDYSGLSTDSFPNTLKCTKPFEPIERYTQKISKAKEWIIDGDIYQVNLSQNKVYKGSCDPFAIFEGLTQQNPAPFSVFMNLPHLTIISSSPERFLKKSGTQLETRPIKGTAPRGRSQQEDEFNLRELLSSEKERAELLMITDLMRNDLGKISLPGTVVTKKMWHSEAYTNVFHMLSQIESRVSPETDPLDIVKSCFPAGSITGCPKIRAMEAIATLEKRARGVYTGSIGYFTGNGDFDFNVAIRTLTVQEGKESTNILNSPENVIEMQGKEENLEKVVEMQVGGAIVYDSNPEQEYRETLHKASSMIKVLE